MQVKKHRLRQSLWANVIFSMSCGITSIIAAQQIAEMMQIEAIWIFYGLGLGLLLFAGSIVFQIRRSPLSIGGVQSIIVQDWLWVLGSAVVIGMQAFGISRQGYWLIAAIALVVMTLALVQGYYLSKCKD